MVWISDNKKRGRILRAVINNYTLCSKPVASRMITDEVNFSSATIRHVMADLEEKGYLKKVHISAGRIPTDRGYRFYIDNLMEKDKLAESETRRIEEVFEEKDESPQEIVKETPHFLCRASRLLGIVLSTEHEIFIDGRSNILEQPEFANINKARQIFRLLEEEERLSSILDSRTKREGVQVSIGRENRYKAFGECSLVTATYKIKRGATGVLGIIGPTRMRYLKIIPMIEYISRKLSMILSGKN